MINEYFKQSFEKSFNEYIQNMHQLVLIGFVVHLKFFIANVTSEKMLNPHYRFFFENFCTHYDLVVIDCFCDDPTDRESFKEYLDSVLNQVKLEDKWIKVFREALADDYDED